MKLDSRGSLVSLLSQLAECSPKMLKRGEPKFDGTLFFLLGQKLADEVEFALNDLRRELVPRHADDTPLINAFWDDLVCEAAANPDLYLGEAQALGELVDQFGDRWKRPLAKYEAVYGIDYLEVGQDPITLLGVEFFAPRDGALAERRISVPDWWKLSDGEEGTFTLASVDVEAADSTTAVETGRRQVADAVTLMRVAALCGVAGKTLDDDYFQWKLSGCCVVREVATEPPEWDGRFCRQSKPLIVDLGHHIRQGIGDLGLELLSDLPEDIRDRILRSIHWIAHSARHETDDHKVVDLCTALEILLLPEGPKVTRKGATIALRYNLLGGGMNPPALKWLYDRRNDVVHGNRLPVVGPMHTWHLRLVCYEVVKAIARSSGGRPDVSTLTDLIGVVETKEKLNAFLKVASRGTYTGSSWAELVKETKKRLKRLESVVE